MSALIGVCGSTAVWLLTDAATVRSDNGFDGPPEREREGIEIMDLTRKAA